MPTSTVHPAACDPQQLLKDCQITRTRRSGPGGQHRNKVETAVVLKHLPTGIEAEAGERRSQPQNQRMALIRLRLNLALNVRSRIDPEQTPNRLWKSRCRNGRIQVSTGHADFPAILAHALDVIVHAEMDVKAAAEMLACTSSQLVKLLQQEPRALLLLNHWRAERGLRPLQ